MKSIIYIFGFLWCCTLYSQENSIRKINWVGQKRMDVSFMTHFIQSKEGEVLDSTKLNYDIQALTRLNGITKATYTVKKQKEDKSNF